MSGYGQRRWAGTGVPGRLAAGSAVGLAVLALVTGASSAVSASSGASVSSAVPGSPSVPDGARWPDSRPPRPAPYVHPFAEQPGVPREATAPSAGAGHPAAAEVDGCDHEYGTPGQCVPWNFPSGVIDRCAWLAAHGLRSLVVVGRDRQRLDSDHDGVACGPGDG